MATKSKPIPIRDRFEAFRGTLPNGKPTRSVDRYVRAYRRLAAPMKKVWPIEASRGPIGYCPGILIGNLSFSGAQSIALYEALTGKTYTC